MGKTPTPNSPYHARLRAASRRGSVAGVLGICYSLGLTIISFVYDSGIINWGVPLYVLLVIPVTLIIWFVGEIFEPVYVLAQLLALAAIIFGTYYLWTYPV